MEYLCQKQGDPLAAAQWLPTIKINNNKLISDYLQQRQDRPFTRSRSAHRTPTVCSMRLQYTKSRLPQSFPFYHWFPLLCPIILVILLLLLGITPFTQASQPPSLGTLFNCDTTQYQGVYSLPPSLSCANPSDTTDISAFHAAVIQYHPQTTKIKLYQCIAKTMSLNCKESFFGAKEKHTYISTTPITPTICRKAVNRKQTPQGKLKQVADSKWSTTTDAKYVCK